MLDPNDILRAWTWNQTPRLSPADSGLINKSWIISDTTGEIGVLQWLNTGVFSPRVHEDIEAVTQHLASKGQPTPRLLRTASGELFHTDAEQQVWRCLSWIGDRTVHKLQITSEAFSAGAAVARFHAGLQDLHWDFRSVRGRFHDTAAHMDRLRQALAAHPTHRLHAPTSQLANSILAAFAALAPPVPLPTRIVHGDLKISNIRFQGDQALAIIDLDTLAHGTLDAELGDAFRSWCNPASEDEPNPTFSLPMLEAGFAGYLAGAETVDFPLTPDEKSSVVGGTLRITLELASRFAADALEERYFGFNPKYGTRGDHNLLRASGQFALVSSILEQRRDAEAIVHRLTS